MPKHYTDSDFDVPGNHLSGTTSERPVTGLDGDSYFDTSVNALFIYGNSAWYPAGTGNVNVEPIPRLEYLGLIVTVTGTNSQSNIISGIKLADGNPSWAYMTYGVG